MEYEYFLVRKMMKFISLSRCAVGLQKPFIDIY